MSIIGSNILAGASGQAGYNLNNSLRFRSSNSANLARTPASATNKKTWTWSGWVKRGALSSGSYMDLFSCVVGPNDITTFRFHWNVNDDALIWGYVVGGNGYYVYSTNVFRDPSAWYHIMCSIDTTQATSTNRVKIYVNGVQVTQVSAGSGYPLQNVDTQINATSPHNIGCLDTYGRYFDGYMTEINFVDGSALTPSSFGETSATTGSWIPKKYTGSYGTNGFYLPFSQNTTSNYAVYTTDLSANYHSLPIGSQGSNFTFSGDFTIEGWILYTSSVGDHSFYVQQGGANYLALNIDLSSGVYNIYCNAGSPTSSFASGITVGNWTHVAMVRSGSTITLYTNGVAKGTITNSSTLGFSSLTLNRLGGGTAGLRYMSNVRITNSAIYTANFVPPTTALTNVANTVVLTYQNATAIDNSSNGYTLTATGSPSLLSGNVIWNANVISDASGNKNHWTPNNLNYSISGVTYDAMLDVPTNTSATVANYAVLNPLDIAGTPTISNGNLKLTNGSAAWGGSRTGFAMTSGKWYWEVTIVSANTVSNGIDLGIANSSTIAAGIGQTNKWVYNNNTGGGRKSLNGTVSAYGVTYVANDIVGIAFDADAGSITFYVNNSSQGVMASTGLPNPAFPYTETYSSDSVAVNFGQRPFTYTAPSGFVALNTYNLPTPTILQGNKYMDATTYTGTGAALTVVNAAQFKPDFVWGKDRAQAQSHLLFDSVRGVHNFLSSNSTSAESTNSTTLTSFNSNGFGLGTNATLNQSGISFVGWQWQAGQGSTSSNTSGTITSTTSVNATAGFSIVTYTGNGGSNVSIGHGLGVTPVLVLTKDRTSTGVWDFTYTFGDGSYDFLELNTTAAKLDISGRTAPTSSLFYVNGSNSNVSARNYVSYIWAEIAGFSKFGSYTGNGSADGPFVFTGFRPKFILIKSTGVESWSIVDTSRSLFNKEDASLFPNLSNAEGTGNTVSDILSNGFKLRNTWAGSNTSAQTYIYMAFAENPFKNANAR